MEQSVIPDTPSLRVHELGVGFHMKAHKRLVLRGELIVNIILFLARRWSQKAVRLDRWKFQIDSINIKLRKRKSQKRLVNSNTEKKLITFLSIQLF